MGRINYQYHMVHTIWITYDMILIIWYMSQILLAVKSWSFWFFHICHIGNIWGNLKYIWPSTFSYWFSFKYFLIPFCHRASSMAWITILLIAPPFRYAMVSNWIVTSSGVSTTKPSLFSLFINGLESDLASALNAYGSHTKAFRDFWNCIRWALSHRP